MKKLSLVLLISLFSGASLAIPLQTGKPTEQPAKQVFEDRVLLIEVEKETINNEVKK